MRCGNRITRLQSGLSYVEVFIAVALIAATIVPAMEGLRGAIKTAEIETEATIRHYQLIGKFETVMAMPYSVLLSEVAGRSTSTSFSDAPGTTDRRLVYISDYDSDNADSDNDPFTGTHDGLLLIRVEIEGTSQAVQSLVIGP